MVLYHFTQNKNVPKIFCEGLRPASETGNKNAYGGITDGDPNYIYLYSEDAIKRRIARNFYLGFDPVTTVKNTTLLGVEIQETFIERDYDQFLIFVKYAKDNAEWRKWLFNRNKKWGWNLELKEFTEAEARLAVTAVPNSIWYSAPGAYRTKVNIKNIVVVPWHKMAPVNIRIAGIFARPYYRIRNARLRYDVKFISKENRS